MSATPPTTPLKIVRAYPTIGRLLVAVLGLVCIVLPAWELRYAFYQFHLTTLFFGVIVAGAWSIGIPLLASAILGDSETWTFEPGAVHVERSSPLRRRIDRVRGADVVRTEVRTIDWDDGARFRVVLHLRTGRRLETPTYGALAEAQRIRSDIHNWLGLDAGT